MFSVAALNLIIDQGTPLDLLRSSDQDAQHLPAVLGWSGQSEDV